MAIYGQVKIYSLWTYAVFSGDSTIVVTDRLSPATDTVPSADTQEVEHVYTFVLRRVQLTSSTRGWVNSRLLIVH